MDEDQLCLKYLSAPPPTEVVLTENFQGALFPTALVRSRLVRILCRKSIIVDYSAWMFGQSIANMLVYAEYGVQDLRLYVFHFDFRKCIQMELSLVSKMLTKYKNFCKVWDKSMVIMYSE